MQNQDLKRLLDVSELDACAMMRLGLGRIGLVALHGKQQVSGLSFSGLA